MCGILMAVSLDGKKVDKEHFMEMFYNQKNRGKSGFGLLTTNGKERKIKIKKGIFLAEGVKMISSLSSNIAIFHHRLPSSTPNLYSQTHPIKINLPDCPRTYYLFHNGTIENDEAIWRTHQKMKIPYSTEIVVSQTKKEKTIKYNDSETLGVELALFIEGRQKKIKVKGGVAFILAMTEKHKLKKIYWGRNEKNPLFIEKKQNIILRSQLSYDDTISLEEQEKIKEKKEVPINKLFCFSLATAKITSKKVTFPLFIPSVTFYPTNNAIPVKNTLPTPTEPTYNLEYPEYSEYPIYPEYSAYPEYQRYPKYLETTQQIIESSQLQMDLIFQEIEETIAQKNGKSFKIDKIGEIENIYWELIEELKQNQKNYWLAQNQAQNQNKENLCTQHQNRF